MNRILSIIILFSFLFPLQMSAQLPEGFVDEEVEGPWDYIVGFVFDEAGGMYAWERGGKIFRVENDQKATAPILDISEEVGFFGDHGMLGMALHPNFLNNGYIYLLYAVDRHHLIHFGTANYDPAASLTNEASIGRVTRYTLNKADSFQTVLPNSRKVLLGARIDDGLPLLHVSHGVGDLLFGYDGSLLLSCGDGSTFKTEFVGGGEEGTYAAQGLTDGIIRPKEDIGSYRSQLVDSHNGKVLRIDPETGEGLPSNPFFDEAAPASPRSRVWAMGFRNPFRMSLLASGGSHNMADGKPGIIYVGDVGSGGWEELNIITEGGQNFGWPLWEGFEGHWGFWSKPTYNQDAPNPLDGIRGCEHPFFRFNDLIMDDTENPQPFWDNPCDDKEAVPAEIPHFLHRRPAVAYSNFLWNQPTRTFVGAFDSEGKATGISIEDAPWDYDGGVFDGTCIINGTYYQADNFPEKYKNRLFFADYNGWMKIMDFDSLGHPVKIEDFHEGIGNIVHLDVNPKNGCLYYTKYKEKELHKICYGTDPAPVIHLQVDRDHGPSPLSVQFDASKTKDPEGQPIRFFWDFGDGNTSTDADPLHVFISEDQSPTPFSVQLTVTDSAGKSSSRELVISLNNTPPQVFITSIAEGDYYSVEGINRLFLEAEVTDKEHAESELRYEWQTFLLHNNHLHPEPIDTNRISETLLEAAGCDGEYYAYRVALTVYDAGGLSTNHEINLWPNCDSFPMDIASLTGLFDQGKVRLDWETNWEKEVTSFEVERAADKLHFQSVGKLDANGGAQQKASYQLIDTQPFVGRNVYRLKIFTANGRYHYSAPIEIETSLGIDIEVYPNPTVNVLAFRFRDMKENASFELFTMNGKKVAQFDWAGKGSSFRQESVGHLQGGMYFYRLQNGSDLMSGKLVIRR